MKVRMRKEEIRTINPRTGLIIAAIAIGSVLKGLKANPTTGKYTGAA